MRRFVLILLLVIPVIAFGQERTKSVVSRVEGGSLVLTNELRVGYSDRAYPISPALELKRIEFTIPSAAFTNTFAIQYARTYELPSTFVNRVETQTVGGVSLIYTNMDVYGGSEITFTNSLTVACTTNDAGLQVYDEDDFDIGLTIEPNDVLTYSFTETNAFDLIQVYTLRQRP